jgi:recombination DNA repair RAD52 pathway protein
VKANADDYIYRRYLDTEKQHKEEQKKSIATHREKILKLYSKRCRRSLDDEDMIRRSIEREIKETLTVNSVEDEIYRKEINKPLLLIKERDTHVKKFSNHINPISSTEFQCILLKRPEDPELFTTTLDDDRRRQQAKVSQRDTPVFMEYWNNNIT